jgi:multiple sugar transport system ATP-binding protein
MAGVTLDAVTKHFGKVVALDQFSLEIVDGEFMVFVGPSGCGKTTALRIIAGLEEATSGSVKIGDRLVDHVPSKDRDIAMVFQAYALYPHMTVRENISFGLNIRMLKSFWWRLTHSAEAKAAKAEIARRVGEAAQLLGIEGLLDRRPRELSGGQRQRVALARAIVREPKVFLMDEPLSNLDAKLRVQTRAELIRLHRRLGITTIYVTHDQVEAMTMGDRIAVLKDGELQQVDTPRALYERPVNTFVASFIGSPPMNLVTVPVENGAARLGDSQFPAPAGVTKVTMGIRPERLRPEMKGVAVKGVVDVVEPLGATKTVIVNVGGVSMIASIDADVKAVDSEPITLFVQPEQVHYFDAETGEAIGGGDLAVSQERA